MTSLSNSTHLVTTVIGSYPKPAYLELPDWFKCDRVNTVTKEYNKMIAEKAAALCLKNLGEFISEVTTYRYGMNELIDRAESEVLKEQIDLGIDIITDGEIRRENYIYYLLRHLKGFDFVNLTGRKMRSEGYPQTVPTVIGPVDIDLADVSKLANEWRKCQDCLDVAVKYTIPGPMTIIESTCNKFYSDVEKLSEDLVRIIRKIINELVDAGCKHIQIDEPLFARLPSRALEYGIRHTASCIQDVGQDVTTILHICCGYPEYFDEKDYLKADRSSYRTLAKPLDETNFNAVSIEDAHCHNDLSFLKMFTKTSVILGCVAIATSKVESVEEIQARIREALKYIPTERLQIAPDCGLGFLPHAILVEKITNMVTAAKSF